MIEMHNVYPYLRWKTDVFTPKLRNEGALAFWKGLVPTLGKLGYLDLLKAVEINGYKRSPGILEDKLFERKIEIIFIKI